MAEHKTQAESKEQRENRFEEMQKELAERGREVWLAGLGALATMEEEGAKLYDRLVQRGKEYEGAGARQIDELTERITEQQQKTFERAEEKTTAFQSALANAVDKALERFGVPTREEVDDLSKKVDALSEQIDALSQQLEKE